MEKLVDSDCTWLDVGCGRDVFQTNKPLARVLADRRRTLVGVDPDETIEENEFVHVRAKTPLGEFRSEEAFNLVTLSMVAEHISDPKAAVSSLSRLTRPGGKVVVYTVEYWSPVSIVSRLTPLGFHKAVKRFLWGTEEKDTFPVAYRMNTRGSLARIFGEGGFREVQFFSLPDCRVFGRFQRLNRLEMTVWRLSEKLRFSYPERCILAIFERL